MTDTPIKLIGLKNPDAFEEYCTSHLVDVAYIRVTGNNCAVAFLDVGMDVQKQADRDWIEEILKNSLSVCGETEAQIVFLRDLAP